MVVLLLVRHGHAGSKRHWRGDDCLRPLSPQGFDEADAIGKLLIPFSPIRIVSSPYVRCVQTVKPLAEELGLRIEGTKRLIPSAGRAASTYLQRVSRKDNGALVICTHGEVIHALQEELSKSVPELFGEDVPREKGSVWVLEREDGHIVKSEYLPPPRPIGSRHR
jgi:8-oxo-dGTP diphosphatase